MDKLIRRNGKYPSLLKHEQKFAINIKQVNLDATRSKKASTTAAFTLFGFNG